MPLAELRSVKIHQQTGRELARLGTLLLWRESVSMRLVMMAGLAAGDMSAVGARRRARLLSAIRSPSAGRGLLQESNDSWVGVVLLRQITPADHLMSHMLQVKQQ